MGIAPTAAPITFGGQYSSGGPEGVYHVIVTDASCAPSSTGRPLVKLDLAVNDDPDHQALNGKKLLTQRQSLDSSEDDPDKAKKMRGMVKRMLYDAYGKKYPTEAKPFDPRIFVGAQAWVLVGPGKPNDAGDTFPEVKAASQVKEKLPKAKSTDATTNGATGATKPRPQPRR